MFLVPDEGAGGGELLPMFRVGGNGGCLEGIEGGPLPPMGGGGLELGRGGEFLPPIGMGGVGLEGGKLPNC